MEVELSQGKDRGVEITCQEVGIGQETILAQVTRLKKCEQGREDVTQTVE